MPKRRKRTYVSTVRQERAQETRANILAAARDLFTARGIEAVRMPEIAKAAGVAVPTLYATFKSREGILHALLEAALFGPHYQSALSLVSEHEDPVQQIAATPAVARAIYDGERRELGVLRDVAAYSPTLRSVEQDFEDTRYARQEARITALFARGRARAGLTVAEARRILWMYTSREIYRMLVVEAGWSGDAYERWLRETLLDALVAPQR
jgi:AcrR family transcriptional regulator